MSRSCFYSASPRFRFIPAAIVTLSAALISAPAFADDTGSNDSASARFTGPLVSSSPPLPKGAWNIEPYLIRSEVSGFWDRDGNRHSTDSSHTWRLAVPVMYGATDRISLGASFNAYYGNGEGPAFGDTRLSLLYLLAQGGGEHTPKLTLAVRQNLDTGHHDQLEQRSTSFATGSGAPTTTLGLYGQAYYLDRKLRGRVNLSWQLPYSGVDVEGRSGYGTQDGFRGEVDLGAEFEGTLGLEYSLSPKWALALDVVYENQRPSDLHGTLDDGSGEKLYRADGPSHSWRVSIAPAIEYHWNDQVGVIFGAMKSLDGRNTSDVFSPQIAVNVGF